jgi:hypothetical protein
VDYTNPSTNPNTVYTSQANTGLSAAVVIFYLAIIVFFTVCYWRIFQKAGEKGWKSLIPIYNVWIELKIINRPGWWLILYLIPLVNIVVALIVSIDMAKAFGKSTLFGVLGLFFFSFVGYPMLAFGSATYTRPADRE